MENTFSQLEGKNVLWLTCHYTNEIYPHLKQFFRRVVQDFKCKIWVVFSETESDTVLRNMMIADGLLIGGGSLIVNMSNEETAVSNIYDTIINQNLTFDAVFSPHEQAQTLVGELSEKLKVPGNTFASYITARDKHLGREVCAAAGVPTPKFARCNNRDEIKALADFIGLPLVLKPSAGAASEGVYKCMTIEDLYAKFDQVSLEMINNPTFNFNPGCNVSILLEEYIDGEEFDVDVLMSEGTAVYANIIDNWPTLEPTFLETGSNCPSIFPIYIQNQIKQYAIDCVKAMAFKQGCFHVEVKYSLAAHRVTVNESTGEKIGQPLLIEVNPRMGGGRTHTFHKEVYGVDLFDYFFLSSCGIAIPSLGQPEAKCCLADYEVSSLVSGVMTNNTWLDHLKGSENVVKAEVYLEAGSKVKGCDTGIPEWIGLILMRGDNAVEIVSKLKQIVLDIEIPIAREEVAPVVSTSRKSSRRSSHVSGHSDTPLVL